MSNPENISSFDLETSRTIAILESQNAALSKRLEHLESTVKELEKDKEKALKWGISLLGAAVLAMGTWIFKLFEKAVL